jgi:hypothetical protein
MRNHAVTLHFSKPEATITTTPFSWLSCQDLGWTTTSRVNLILNHMLQSLVIGRSQEDHDFHLLATEAIIHHFIASKLVAQVVQLIRNPFNSVSIATLASSNSLERCSVTFSASECCNF